MPAALKHLSGPKERFVTALAKWADGNYYLVEVGECDSQLKRCFVKFEDTTECWLDTASLHLQLADDLPEDEIVCCVCDGETSSPPNDILMCDCCQQGYHVDCACIDRQQAKPDDEDVEWVCETCKYISDMRTKQIKKTNTPSKPKTPTRVKVKVEKTPKKRDTVKGYSPIKHTPSDLSPIQSSPSEKSPITGPEKTENKAEHMDPIVIKAAKALASDQIDTRDFVQVITDVTNDDQPKKEKTKLNGIKRKSTKKSNTSNAAAF